MTYIDVSSAITAAQRRVREFQAKHFFALEVLKPQYNVGARYSVLMYRIKLIQEELAELAEAMSYENSVKIADALGDLTFVTLGTGNTVGMDLGPIFKEICYSNMTKDVGGDEPKGPSYRPPLLEPILREQGFCV